MANHFNKGKELLSDISVNPTGQLCELIDFGEEKVEYKISGITEHVIYGIFFSFEHKSEPDHR